MAVLITFHVSLFSSSDSLARPTQDEVFRSIEENVGKPMDSGPLLGMGLAAAGVVLLIVVFSHRRQRPAVARPLNHTGKLLREVTRTLPLRPREIRQLKALAERSSEGDVPVTSPLTLLLCPSLLEKAAKANKRLPAADRKALAHLVRKLGA